MPPPPLSVFDLLGCPHSMGKTGSVSAAVLPLGKSVAVGRGLSDPLILYGGRVWLLADTVLLVALSWLCHPPVASSSYAAPFPSREKFPFCGNFHFPGKTCLCWHCTVPCNHLQTSCGTRLSRTCPEKMDGSQGPPAFCLQEKASLSSGTLSPSSHPRFSWCCPHRVPALHTGCSGPIHVCTHMPLVCKIKPPTT